MTRTDALPYVSYILDDSLNVTSLSERPIQPDARLVGWKCGFEPMFIAVQSYLPGVVLEADEAEEIAKDYLAEVNWFHGEPYDADYII